jgi:hypothetical protein
MTNQLINQAIKFESWYDAITPKAKADFFNYAFGYGKDFMQKLINTNFYDMDLDLQCDMLTMFFEGCWYQLNNKWYFQEPYINKLEGINN